jgi:hypothetical protein
MTDPNPDPKLGIKAGSREEEKNYFGFSTLPTTTLLIRATINALFFFDGSSLLFLHPDRAPRHPLERKDPTQWARHSVSYHL